MLVNAPELAERAEIIREKGTDRSRFFRGEVDRYTWVDVGSSFLPGELISAFLYAQMEEAEEITSRRLAIWRAYHELLADQEDSGHLRRPIIPGGCAHNAQTYYILAPDPDTRKRLLAYLKEKGVHGVFHYVPLHSSPAGQRFGRTSGELHFTTDLSGRLIRLPLWVGLTSTDVESICGHIRDFFSRFNNPRFGS